MKPPINGKGYIKERKWWNVQALVGTKDWLEASKSCTHAPSFFCKRKNHADNIFWRGLSSIVVMSHINRVSPLRPNDMSYTAMQLPQRKRLELPLA